VFRPRPTPSEFQEVIDQRVSDELDVADVAIPGKSTTCSNQTMTILLARAPPEEDSTNGQPSWWITRICAVPSTPRVARQRHGTTPAPV